jgi:hypothetical protein
MNEDKKQRDYLYKAKEADQEAAKAKTDEMRASWTNIAQSYRDLAAQRNSS